MKTGVCYYPEHWPEDNWADDARQMFELGIRVVRIGEFSWSRLERRAGEFDFGWLLRAMDQLADAGLEIVLGTPTATPPKWLVDQHPQILACDQDGNPRGFGSRRHYCFSSPLYRRESRRITTQMAQQLGRHPGLAAWQTDNEYGCHDTIQSYSDAAREGFRRWLRQRYGSIEALNQAWGNVFWSMEYPDFDSVELPNLAVTELNPAHRLAFWRYSGDAVRAFNREQVDILREHTPDLPIIHNFMGNFTQFDHFSLQGDIDIASWDNYPLGFLDRDDHTDVDRLTYLRTGHPDSSAFHHDLYRSVGNGRWWIMEQQPGPVNWAPHNPSPLDGMVKFWGFEGFCHGAEVVSWFRWRQCPFGQEQLHSALMLPDGRPDQAATEVEALNRMLTELPTACKAAFASPTPAPVAIVFDYEGDALQRILRLGGEAHDPLRHTREIYAQLRLLGQNVDIISPAARLEDYRLVILPLSSIDTPQLATQLQSASEHTHIVLLPGTASRTPDASIVEDLPPGTLKSFINLRVVRTESLPDTLRLSASEPDGRGRWQCRHWRERVESSLTPNATFDDGWGFLYRQNNIFYLNALLEDADLARFLQLRLTEAGLGSTPVHGGLRLRHAGVYTAAFNFGPESADLSTLLKPDDTLLSGDTTVAPAAFSVWQHNPVLIQDKSTTGELEI